MGEWQIISEQENVWSASNRWTINNNNNNNNNGTVAMKDKTIHKCKICLFAPGLKLKFCKVGHFNLGICGYWFPASLKWSLGELQLLSDGLNKKKKHILAAVKPTFNVWLSQRKQKVWPTGWWNVCAYSCVPEKYIREAKYIIVTVKTILTNSRRGKLYEALAFGSQRYKLCPLYLKFWPYLIRIHLCNSADMTENKHY